MQRVYSESAVQIVNEEESMKLTDQLDQYKHASDLFKLCNKPIDTNLNVLHALITLKFKIALIQEVIMTDEQL